MSQYNSRSVYVGVTKKANIMDEERSSTAQLILITWQSKKCLLCAIADMSMAMVPPMIDRPSLPLPLAWGAPMDIALAWPCMQPSPIANLVHTPTYTVPNQTFFPRLSNERIKISFLIENTFDPKKFDLGDFSFVARAPTRFCSKKVPIIMLFLWVHKNQIPFNIFFQSIEIF